MALQFESLGTYFFSGKFPLPLPRESTKRTRVLYADIQLMRPPRSPYFDIKTSRPNGFLGTMLAMQDNQVLQRYNIEYERVRIYLQKDLDDQLIYALRCYSSNAANNLRNLGLLLNVDLQLTPYAFSEELTALHLYPTELLFKAYKEAAFKVDVYGLNVLECNQPGDTPTPDPPPPPTPVPPPSLDSSEPIPRDLVSPPPPDTNPEDYEPFPIDPPFVPDGETPVDPPVGDDCVSVRVTISYIQIGGDTPIETSNLFWGPVSSARLQSTGPNPSDNEVQIFSKGNAGLGGDPCGQNDWYGGIASNNIESFELISVEVI